MGDSSDDFEKKIMPIDKDGALIDMKLRLAPGQLDYAVVNPIDQFVLFSVQFDVWSGTPAGADGDEIVWREKQRSNKGKWFHVLEVENKSSVTVTVVVQAKALPK